MELTLDIETVEAQDPKVRAHVEKRAIEKARKDGVDDFDEIDRLVAEALDKTALDGVAGEIVCLGVKRDDKKATAYYREKGGESERDMLLRFRTDILKLSDVVKQDRWTLIGHNLYDFDRPFIAKRAMIHGIKMPWIFTFDCKPWETTGGGRLFDTMLAFGSTRGKGYVSMDSLAVAFGLPGKGDITGADVGRLWREGRSDLIARYCAAGDVETTHAIYKRMTTLE